MPLGITSKLYLNISTWITPTWLEVPLVADANVNLSWNKADGSTRLVRVEQGEPTNLVMGFSGRVRKKMNDNAFIVLRSAFLLTAIVDVMILDGDKNLNGSDGVRFEGKVFNWGEDQALQNVIFKDFSIEPCISENIPQSVFVAGGVPVYTPIAAALPTF